MFLQQQAINDAKMAEVMGEVPGVKPHLAQGISRLGQKISRGAVFHISSFIQPRHQDTRPHCITLWLTYAMKQPAGSFGQLLGR